MAGVNLVELQNVELLNYNGDVLLCRVDGRVVAIPPRRLLPGSEVRQRGNAGTLVLTRESAEMLGLL